MKQLHIHIIARNKDDITFPKPVWGNSMAKKYQNNDKYIFAQLDCNKYQEFQDEFNSFNDKILIEGFPTFLLFIKGIYVTTYKDQRTGERYTQFLNQYSDRV